LQFIHNGYHDYDHLAANAIPFNLGGYHSMMMDILFLIAILVFTLIAIFSKRLLISAVSLGLVSVILSIIFFDLGAPFAGGFELSIGAGLISILFIMAISLTEMGKHES
jgi:NADH:ubiquinone oxidoreductase subunit 6 (subunit J)